MAFWGVELKPDKVAPFVPPPEAVDGKLHVSQVGRTMLTSATRHTILTKHLPLSMQDVYDETKSVSEPCPNLCSASVVLACLSCSSHSNGTLSCALQATIAGEAPAGSRAVLKCKVQDGPWLRMCSLREGGTECCGLDLIYDQYTEFVVEGDAGLHLTGRWTEAWSLASCPARCIVCMQ